MSRLIKGVLVLIKMKAKFLCRFYHLSYTIKILHRALLKVVAMKLGPFERQLHYIK